MPLDTLLALFAFALVSSATPGPNTLMLLASGVNFGFRRSLPHMFGVVAGFCLMLLCIGFAYGFVAATWKPLHGALKIAGGGYLLYLSWRIATAASLRPNGGEPAPMSLGAAMVFQWVNPKAWMMGLSAMAIYTQPSDPTASVLYIVAMFGLVGAPTVALWAGFGSSLRRWLEDPLRRRWFNRAMGLLLALTLLPLLLDDAMG